MTVDNRNIMTVDNRPPFVKKIQPFAAGGLGGCIATCCVQPIDMVKVRIQIIGETKDAKISRNPISVARNLFISEGFSAFYKGLDAGLIRQLTYTTARMGIFRVVSDNLKSPEEETLPLYKKAFAGLFAGGAAALIGNPADLSLIRMQADSTLPLEQRRNYTGIFNALCRTVKEDGIIGLWRGSTPTMLRAMSLNMGMLASYDQAKEMIPSSVGTGMAANLIASGISGFFAVTFSLPFDFVKTRIQRMKADSVTGEMPYRNFYDCASKVLRREGPLAFYTGYPTYYVRIAPHAMITLLVTDAINKGILSIYA